MNGSVSQLVSVAACCLLLAGCASNPSYSSPVIDFAGISCDEQPDLSTAVSLEPKKQKKFIEVLVPVSDNAPCLATAKGNIPYELLALPMITENKMFEIGSAVEPLRFFLPAFLL